MRDMTGMLRQAKDMQDKMTAIQEEIIGLEATGISGGGLVSVVLSGKGTMNALRIDPSLFKEEEMEIIEDLIIAAHNEAKTKIEDLINEKMKTLTGGLSLPAGFKLPF